MFYVHQFLSQIYATVKWLGWVAHQISFKIKMYYYHPLQHLAVLFLLFDQVVAMASHLTMPGWHHQGTGLRPAKYAQCRPLSRWMYVGRREDGWLTSCNGEADWTHNHVTAIWLWSFTKFKLSLCTLQGGPGIAKTTRGGFFFLRSWQPLPPPNNMSFQEKHSFFCIFYKYFAIFNS